MQKIINIISGKGGTGKTLLTAVMAEMLSNEGYSILVIDLDVFVRGLTTLLYFEKKQTLNLVKDGQWSVSNFFKLKGKKEKEVSLAICQYRSFDVVPSVTKVDEILIFKDIMPNTIEEAKEILTSMLNYVSKEYNFVFLDSRAGYDELIAATHNVSDFSICVEEDDDISMVTSNNLIAQLKRLDINKPIFRIRNKVRQLHKNESSSGIEYIGSIPFDTDILNSFGTRLFWEEIRKSLYRVFLTKAWNTLSNKMTLNVQLEERRVSPLGAGKLEMRISMLSTINRVSFIYGLIIVLLSFYLVFYESGFYEVLLHNPEQLVGLSMGIFGILLIASTIFFNNKK